MTEQTNEKKVAAKAPMSKAPMSAPVSGGTIFVKRTGSPIRRDARQREYLKGLGLSRMNQVRELIDSPEVRGIVRKAQHMVQIVDKA
jgi:large subunit ribosomal protein L30